ncbi:MAG: hypothetical protein H0X26_09585 [Alphaproteobacteria bacterium]|nr:hypothetical protein [Alphaproteobacteria bacterium]
MTGQNQPTDSQASSLLTEVTDLPPTISLKASSIFPHSSSPLASFASNQKIEITFAQGHRLCLEGSFDWNELRTWLTPLLTGEQ